MSKLLKFATVAALVAFGGASAFAQSSDMKAKIPFAFATPGGGYMPAGLYEVAKLNSSATTTYRILNVETKQSVVAMASDVVRRPAAGKVDRPELTFKCAGEGNCAISGVFRSGSTHGDGIRAKIRHADPTTQIAEIAIPFGE